MSDILSIGNNTIREHLDIVRFVRGVSSHCVLESWSCDASYTVTKLELIASDSVVKGVNFCRDALVFGRLRLFQTAIIATVAGMLFICCFKCLLTFAPAHEKNIV